MLESVQVQLLVGNKARISFRFDSYMYLGDIDVILDFNFWQYPHVLTLANDYVTTAIQLVQNEFNQNFGVHGLGRNFFYVGNSLTVTVLTVSDYGVLGAGDPMVLTPWSRSPQETY